MEYSLRTLFATVVDNSVSVLCTAELCDFRNFCEYITHDSTVVLVDIVGTGEDVLLGDNYYVNRCLGIDILESKDFVILINLV